MDKRFTSLLDKNQMFLADMQKKSRMWFFNQADMLASQKITPNKLLNDAGVSTASNILPGELYFYAYDPKHKDTLPYYDRYPMVFPFRKTKNGFIGLNMHYLPYHLRIQLFEALYQTKTNKFVTENTRLKISWDIIRAMSQVNLAKPCIKEYLGSHIKSKIVKIDPVHWETALLMPVQRFQKQTAVSVWQDSIRMAKGKK